MAEYTVRNLVTLLGLAYRIGVVEQCCQIVQYCTIFVKWCNFSTSCVEKFRATPSRKWCNICFVLSLHSSILTCMTT